MITQLQYSLLEYVILVYLIYYVIMVGPLLPGGKSSIKLQLERENKDFGSILVNVVVIIILLWSMYRVNRYSVKLAACEA